MIALDTNLLVYAHRAGVPEHRRAQRAIERASRDAEGWGFSLPVVAEFWSVVTHPALFSRRSTPGEAGRFLKALVEAGAAVWPPGPGLAARLLQLAADLDVAGPRIFDLQIALIAFEGGATSVWTADRRFVSVPGLPVTDPFAT
jgi:uncharacterized protein